MWLGTAFNQLDCARALGPHLLGALAATTYPDREAQLVAAYQQIGRMHNALGVTAPVPVDISFFHERPYRVIDSEAFVTASEAAIEDATVRAWPPRVGVDHAIG